jgi:hypothetical protein
MNESNSIGYARSLRHAAVLSLLLAARLSASSTGTPTELTLTADVDGDTRPDAVIVDRASGAYRIGYQLGAGAFTWVPARASGIGGVSTAGAGRLLVAGRDALVFTGPDANRVNVLRAESPLDAGEPLSLFAAGVGPVVAVPIDIPGNLNTPFDDVAVLSAENGLPSPGRLAQLRNVDGVFSALSDGAVDGIPMGGGRVRVKAGGESLVGVLERVGNQKRFRVLRPGALPPVVVAQASGLAADGFAFGQFAASGLHHFVFVVRGATSVTALPVTEPQPGQFAFGAAQSLDLGFPVGSVTVLSTTSARLLVLSEDGSEARIYTWTGVGAPSLVQTVMAPAGESLVSAVALPDGSFQVYRGSEPGGPSSRWEGFRVQGGVHVSAGGGALPTVNPRAMAANVFLFANEPFVAPQPQLLRSLNASDWVSGASFAGNPAQVNASAERFGTAAQGLDNPESRQLGPVPPGATFHLINQVRPVISMMSFLPAAGDQPVQVQAQPVGGFQRTAVEVRFFPIPAAAPVFFRTSPAAAWVQSDGKPLSVVDDTTVEFYAQLAGTTTKSPLQRVTYTFAKPPGGMDTDGDGVPDFVEKARGLAPDGGADTDGDGFTDKNELIVGTDPLNADPKVNNAVPSDAQRLDEDAAYDLAVGPRPWDGTTGAATVVAEGVELDLHALGGGRIGQGAADALGLAGVTDPAVRFVSVAASAEVPLVMVATDAHFDVATAGSDKRIGRELVGFVTPPVTPVTPVNYVPGNGSPAVEATAWINAAKAAQASSPRVLLKRSLGPLDSLAALLLERRVNELLVLREVKSFNTTNVTLMPFRTGDANRVAPTADHFAELRQRLDNARPGYDVRALFAAIDTAVQPPGSAALEPLRALTRDIYAISSRSNNIAPGQFDLPVDVLRRFLRTGQLPVAYSAVTSVSPANRTAAFNAAQALLAGLPARPTVTLDLTVTADGLGDECTVLVETGTQVLRNLVADGGARFQFPEAFEMIPGARVQVFAYADAPASGCPGTTYEVISAALLSVPPAPVVDLNQNFIADDWECFFLGGGVDGYGDGDGDGFSDLQEFLDGTDPKDALSKSQKAVKLELPLVDIELGEGNGVKLEFDYPAEYAALFEFALEGTDDLGVPFVTEVIAQPDGNGHYALLLPAVQKSHAFFRLVQRKK